MISLPRTFFTCVLPIAACLLPAGLALADTARVAPVATRVAMVSATTKAASPAQTPHAMLDLRIPDVTKLPSSVAISDSAETQEPQEIAVINVSAEMSPDWHMSRAGVGSVYWITRHRAQAWMILAPLAADADTRLYRDVTVQCEMLATNSAYQAGCP
jgi:hypothetical protein